MKATGAIFEEPPVHSDKGDRLTNDIKTKSHTFRRTNQGHLAIGLSEPDTLWTTWKAMRNQL